MNKEQNYVTVDTGSYIVGKGLTSVKNLVKKVREYEKDGNGTGHPIKNIQGVTVIDGKFDPILKDEPNNKGRIRTVINVSFLHWYFATNGIDKRDSSLKTLGSEFKGQLKGQWIGHSKATDGNFYGQHDRNPIINAEFEEIPIKNNDSDILAVKLEYEQRRNEELKKEIEEYKEQLKDFIKTQSEQQQRLFEITENNQRLLQNQQSLQIPQKQLQEDTTKRKWWQRKRD